MKNGDIVISKTDNRITWIVEDLDNEGTCKLKIMDPNIGGYTNSRYTEKEILNFGYIKITNWQDRIEALK